MNVLQFSDLEQKIKNGEQLALRHNAYASQLMATTGQVLKRYDLLDAKSCIIKTHMKHYGLTSKYDGKGNLRG